MVNHFCSTRWRLWNFFLNRNYHNFLRQNQSKFEGVEILLIFKFAFKGHSTWHSPISKHPLSSFSTGSDHKNICFGSLLRNQNEWMNEWMSSLKHNTATQNRISFSSSTQNNTACEQALGALWRRGGKRRESLQLRLRNLNICIEKVDTKCRLADMTLVMTSLPLALVFQCLFTFTLVSATR